MNLKLFKHVATSSCSSQFIRYLTKSLVTQFRIRDVGHLKDPNFTRSKPYLPSSFLLHNVQKTKENLTCFQPLVTIREQGTFLIHEIPMAAFQKGKLPSVKLLLLTYQQCHIKSLLEPTLLQLTTAQKTRKFGFK